MPLIYNFAKKAYETVPAEQAQQLVGSGSHAFADTDQVKVVGPNGEKGTADGKDVKEFLDGGYRLQNEHEQKVDALNDRLGNLAAPAAAGAGLASAATFGLSDVAARAISPQAAQTISDIKEASPNATIAGNVAGALLPGGLLGKAVGAAGNVARGIVGAGEGLVPTLARATLSGVLEGGVIGAQQGVTEAALGKPEEVAENLLHNIKDGVVMGGLVNGAFGAVGGIAPYVGSIAKSAISGTASTAKTVAEKILAPKIEARLGKDVADKFTALINDPEAKQALHIYDTGVVQEAQKAAASNDQLLSNFTKSQMKMLQEDVKGLSTEATDLYGTALEAAKGDARKALSTLDTARDRIYGDLPKLIESQPEPSTNYLGRTFMGQLDDAQKEVTRLGTDRSVSVAGRLSQIQMPLRSLGDATIGNEIEAVHNVRKQLREMYQEIRERNDPVRKALEDTYNKFNNFLGEEATAQYAPAITTLRQMDAAYAPTAQAYEAMKKAITTRNPLAANNLGINEDKFFRMMSTPEGAQGFQNFLGRIDESASTLDQAVVTADKYKSMKAALEDSSAAGKKVADAADQLAKMQQARDELAQKIASTKGLQSSIREGLDSTALQTGIAVRPGQAEYDMADALTNLFSGSKNIADRAAAIKEKVGLMQATEGMTPFDKVKLVNDALGRSTPEAFTNAAKYSDQLLALARLDDVSKASAAAALPRQGRILAGAVFGGPVGKAYGVANAALSMVDQAAMNPLQTVRRLAALDSAAKAGAAAVDSAVSGVSSALTSPVVTSTANRVAIPVSLMRDNFAAQQERIQGMSDPARVQGALKDFADAPKLQAALASQMKATASFLQSKLPKDPFGGVSGLPGDKPWTPSDTELSKFNRYLQAANDPKGVINNLAAGRATPEEVETLKALYPAAFQKVQKAVLEKISTPGVEVPYGKKLQIGLLLNGPTDRTMRPAFISGMQSVHQQAKDQGAKNPVGRPPSTKPMKFIDNVQTSVGRITNGKR